MTSTDNLLAHHGRFVRRLAEQLDATLADNRRLRRLVEEAEYRAESAERDWETVSAIVAKQAVELNHLEEHPGVAMRRLQMRKDRVVSVAERTEQLRREVAE